MKYINILILIVVAMVSCKKELPIDEDGLLITTRQECYVSNFNLLGSDFITVKSTALPNPVIDTTAQTINIEVRFDADLKHLYPQFTLAQDCKLEPKITGFTDFSDLSNPKKYTVISGNRQVRKIYTVNITVKPL